jgi:anhydro-N-acetylmuramic acid kinase
MAAAGRVDRALLRRLLAHPFLALPPPRSTGREAFGQAYADALIRNRGARGARDLIATATRFTAEAIHRSYADFVLPGRKLLEVIVSGGGARNPVLMAHLRELFAPVPVRPVAEHGLTPENKEAVAFALLAHENLHGHPGNLPAATGAGWPVVLGQVAW